MAQAGNLPHAQAFHNHSHNHSDGDHTHVHMHNSDEPPEGGGGVILDDEALGKDPLWVRNRAWSAGVIVFAVVFLHAFLEFPEAWWVTSDYSFLATPGDRLAHTVKLCFWPSAFAAFLFVRLSRASPQNGGPEALNPLGGHASRAFRVKQRVLTNTMEQAFIFLPPLIGLSVNIPGAYYRCIPLLLFFWTAGRVFYLLGYSVVYERFSLRFFGLSWNVTATLLVYLWHVKIFFWGE